MNRYYLKKYTRKWHRYLGLILGIQFLLWTVGGIYFSWTDIANIRGEDIKKEKSTWNYPSEVRPVSELFDSLKIVFPKVQFEEIKIVEVLGQLYYQLNIRNPHKEIWMFDVRTLAGKNHFSEKEAIRIATTGLKKPSEILKIERITETGSHHEYRKKPLPAYAITFDRPNNTTIYVYEKTGEIQSYRNTKWRFFDFLWMLHTMDYAERDHFNNLLLRVFSIFGLITLLSGFLLFFLTSK